VLPQSLVFGEVAVTSRQTEFVTVENGSRAPETVSLSFDTPFESARELVLQPGESSVIPVTFIPRLTGVATGLLRFSTGNQVALKGVGVDSPMCQTPWSCWTASLSEGQCVTQKKPNGTICEAPCLTQATCENGTCIGAAKQCSDDGNACTLERCDNVLGCVSTMRTCAKSKTSCASARCDNLLGCVEESATDGTECGTTSCSGAHICIAGACVERAMPNGSFCQPAGFCHEAGRCENAQCVAHEKPIASRPLSRPLDYVYAEENGLVWGSTLAYSSIGARAEIAFHFDGGIDFEIPLGPQEYRGGHVASNDMLFSYGTLNITGSSDFFVQARNQSGQLLWNRPVGEVPKIALDGNGNVVVRTASRLSLLARLTGHLLWSISLPTSTTAGEPIGAQSGGAFATGDFHLSDGGTARSFFQFDAQGRPMKTVALELFPELKAVSGAVVWFQLFGRSGNGFASLKLADAGTYLQLSPGWGSHLFESENHTMQWLWFDGQGASLVDAHHSVPIGRFTLAQAFALRDERTMVLALTSDGGTGTTLITLNKQKQISETCHLPSNFNFYNKLANERLIVAPHLIYELPGAIPVSGVDHWQGPFGNNQNRSIEVQ
jgi:hypothetical protein